MVRPGELGTGDDIEEHAAQLGLPVHRVDLDVQFRCGGSAAYVQWVLWLLGLAPGGPVPWEPDGAFEVETALTPAQLEDQLRSQFAEGYGARMTAGYCCPWSNPRDDGTLVPDVTVGGWAKPGNVRGDRAVGGARPSALSLVRTGASSRSGASTRAGLRVRLERRPVRPRLRVADRPRVIDRTANKDPDFKNRSKVSDQGFERLVRNVNKVLLTRGVVGTVITSVDPETQQLLERLTGAEVRSVARAVVR